MEDSMKNHHLKTLIIAILIPLAIGALSALLSGDSTLYAQINRPALSPPGFLFPIVWTILYILMGISSYGIYISSSPDKWQALKTYGVQLFFNFLWSILFFGLTLYLPAFFWLLALIFLIALMIYRFYQIKPWTAYLQIPYLLWCLFAAYLNLSIYLLN